MPYLTDGYQTLITFTENALVLLKEREVQPPELDGAGEIDTTTMRNDSLRTKQPKALITMGECTLQCQYDPAVYIELLAMININQEILINFPDGSILTFFGWVGKFTPAALKEGEFPMAEVKIYCSNQDTSGNETLPTFTAA